MNKFWQLILLLIILTVLFMGRYKYFGATGLGVIKINRFTGRGSKVVYVREKPKPAGRFDIDLGDFDIDTDDIYRKAK